MDPDGEFAERAELMLLCCTFGAMVKGISGLLSGVPTTTSSIIEGFKPSSYGFWKANLGIGK